MNQGDVWLITLPAVGGREQAGLRPGIVLQDAIYGQKSPLVVVVPLTSNQGASRFPATVVVGPDAENKLSTRSIAMVFQVRALDRGRFRTRLGRVSPEILTSVLAELDRLLGRLRVV